MSHRFMVLQAIHQPMRAVPHGGWRSLTPHPQPPPFVFCGERCRRPPTPHPMVVVVVVVVYARLRNLRIRSFGSSAKLRKTFHILRIVMETWAMVMLALVSVYGLVRFIQDVRDYLSKRPTQPVTPTPNTKTKQCQGPTHYTRKNKQPRYDFLKDSEFGAWGEVIW